MCISKEHFKTNSRTSDVFGGEILRERNTITKQHLIPAGLMTEKANPALVPFMENGSDSNIASSAVPLSECNSRIWEAP